MSSEPLRFYWFFFIQHPASQDRDKFHAVTDNPVLGNWRYEREKDTLVTSDAVAMASVVGNLGSASIDDFEAILRAIPVGGEVYLSSVAP
ncbi:hypothetical protein DFH08DRAFT_864989 [Mycena albidolilacea]|uniref:Uncharacterized protein n=1 Tax=Mycena albidolilacea TaxID=1033008 RepID=A0AAD7ESH2_9AGAR|nr:hypothetical protein DFH08DRAFT_864989 [Mycena albidolilacea]